MWRLTMFLLCLTAAFSGTLLRQAEAASDFERARGEILHGNVIELIDGGVGDDSGATITRAGGNTHLSPATGLLAPAATVFPPPSRDSSLPILDDRRWAELLTSLPAGYARRHAWLQCFLI